MLFYHTAQQVSENPPIIYRLKAPVGKRIFVKIDLILRKIVMMSQKSPIRQEDAEIANALRKLRILSKLSKASYAKALGINEEILDAIEQLDVSAPVLLVKKAAAEAGLQFGDLTNGRLDRLFDDADLNITNFISNNFSNSRLYDLVNYFSLIREELQRENVLKILKMLACDMPQQGRILHLVKDSKS